MRARAPRQAGTRNTTQESSKFFVYGQMKKKCGNAEGPGGPGKLPRPGKVHETLQGQACSKFIGVLCTHSRAGASPWLRAVPSHGILINL